MRPGHWTSRTLIATVIGLLCTFGGSAGSALAVNDEPLTQHWAPSEWGPNDTAGAVNRTTPALVLKATKLVKRGKVATLGKVYAGDAPAFGVRTWKMVIPGLPTGGPFGPQELYYNDEFLATEIGQIGTQFDGPGHIGVKTSKGIFFYNGRSSVTRGSAPMAWARWASSTWARSGSCAAACCSTRSRTAAADS